MTSIPPRGDAHRRRDRVSGESRDPGDWQLPYVCGLRDASTFERLLPRWLSGWGIVAALLMLTACVLAVFQDGGITGYTPLIVPIALQEMVLAVWLLAKGFSQPVSARIERKVPGVALVSVR